MTPIDNGWLAANPLPDPGEETDKNSRGRVLAAGGSTIVPGGLLLTGEAAFRAGAGKVQLATVAEAAIPLGICMPEAAAFPLAANEAGELGEGAGAVLSEMLSRCDAAVIGPGMGPKADTVPILRTLLGADCDQLPLILDAAMIGAARHLESEARRRRGHLVLTPHPGEMAVLMDCDEDAVTPELAQHAAERFDATVALKRADTWIASPGSNPLYYPGGGPGLATGGSGDVLAGIIVALLARGAAPRVAAGWGVWLHGEAGKSLAARQGKLGFLARELPAEVPALMER